MTKQKSAGSYTASRRGVAAAGIALALVLFSGCVHAPLNRPLTHYDALNGYRPVFYQANHTNDVLFLMFFSGGGTRAAALSYGVLKQLDHTPVETDGGRGTLLDRVNFISAVSGGSFTAAYYCLYGDRIFQDYERRFLKRDIQGDLERQLFLPYNWPRLASPDFSRTDLTAEYYDHHLFKGATFADLEQRRKMPYLLINATDLGTGGRFAFSQYWFDLLGSDIASYPIARAVAASSALPIYFAPVTLRNYSRGPGHEQSEWLNRLEQTNGRTSGQTHFSERLESYSDSRQRPYIHLVDGGLADNLGLSSFMEVTLVFGGVAHTLEHFHLENVSKIVVVMVDASVHRKLEFDQSEHAPNVLKVIATMGGNLVNRNSYDTEEAFQANMEHWRTAKVEQNAARHPGQSNTVPELKYYFINVNFDLLRDPAERSFFENLPTSFDLPSRTVDRIRDAGGQLLEQSDDYQRLLRDLNADGSR